MKRAPGNAAPFLFREKCDAIQFRHMVAAARRGIWDFYYSHRIRHEYVTHADVTASF
jgi:hypothetical protein